MGYLSASQAAENRIQGAFKVGEVWAIPDDAPKPMDNRKKNKENE